MPIAKVQLEDGRIGRFEVPEGTTPDQVMEFVASFSKQKPMSDNGASWSGIDNFASGVLQGMGDEVKALTQATKAQFQGGPSFGNAYEQAKTMYQGARQKYAEENPVTAAVTDIAGQAAPWLVAAPLMPALSAPTMMGRLLKSGATGAGIGAVSGALNAEGDLGDRAIGAGTGAVIGGAVGAVTPPVVEGISKLGRGAYNQIIGRMPFQQESVAARKVAEALMRDGLTPDQAAAKMAQMGPEAALMDVGANSRGLARQAATVPGEGKSRIADFLTKRQEGVLDQDMVRQGGQFTRLNQAIDSLIPDNFAQKKADIVSARKTLGKNYNAARDADEVVDVLPIVKELDDEIVSAKGSIKRSLESIRSLLHDNNGKPEITIDALHQAKIAIDDLMGSGDARNSMGNIAKARVRDYQSRLVDAIESTGQAGKDYQVGRLGTAGQWRLDEALDAGTTFAHKGKMPDVSKYSPEELHNFRVGVAQWVRGQVDNTAVRNDSTKKLFEVPGLEQKIRQAFDDPDMFRKYMQNLQNEKTMFDSYGKIMGGSRTGEVLAEQADATVDPSRIMQGLQRMASSNPIDWVAGGAQALGGVKDRVVMPQPTSRKLGEILTSQNLGPIRQQYQASQMSAAQRAALAKALVAGGSSQGQ